MSKTSLNNVSMIEVGVEVVTCPILALADLELEKSPVSEPVDQEVDEKVHEAEVEIEPPVSSEVPRSLD